jgi:GT2 family glycosyltransferase
MILVDNASLDGGADWVEATFPQVHVIRSAINIGYGGGNNLGARAARGELLVFLNPDTSVDPGWLEPLISTLQSDPSIGMVTSQILLMEEPDRINTCGNDVHLSGITLCRGMGRSRSEYVRREDVAAVSGAAFAMRRQIFLDLGGFDADYFLYMEDTDLSLRARLIGLRILFIPESIVFHAYKLRFGPRKVYYQERNRSLMLLKLLRWPSLFLLLPTFLWAEIVTWSFVLLRDRNQYGNKFRAIGWILGHAKAILNERRRVQSIRQVGDRALLALCSDRLDFEQMDFSPALGLAGWTWNLVSAVLGRMAMLLLWW